ncbi:nucleotide exchange factor GrpE [Halorussus amylolyticus]|uniref:nucleotide exchange factor GrpE n=1 Tax=Halorussus amylolyticus TaxID=1126242 RepID=UPI0010429C40|nr:nucleotide exchange factor GrpE [Halorussus amylolyticus]
MTDEEATEQVRADAEPAADDADAGTESAVETDDALGPKSTSLVAKVALEDDSLADDLEAHLADLEAEAASAADARERAEELESKLKRNRADFQNYKKRAKKRQEQMEARATEDLVERLLDVRDNLVRALDSDHDDVESIREGVEMTLKELDRVFADEDVSEIDPEPGTETDPQRHEVMMRVESDQPEGTVADVYQPGYEMGEKVLRAAQVTVSDGGE